MWSRPWRRVLPVAVAVSLALGAYLAVLRQQDHARVQALVTALGDEQTAARREGRTPVAPPPASILATPKVVSAPPRPAPTVDVDGIVAQVLDRIPTPRDGRPPTADEIARALVGYCTEHGCPPVAQVTTLVAQQLAAHPPAPGPTGAQGEIGPACDPALNPDCRGPQGEKGDKGDPGEPGHSPTAEELDAAVERVLAEENVLTCPGEIAERTQLDGEVWRVCVASPAPTPTTATPTSTSTAPTEPPPGGP